MVLTRRRAADSGTNRVSPDHQHHHQHTTTISNTNTTIISTPSTTTAPDNASNMGPDSSNLNLLASSASTEALHSPTPTPTAIKTSLSPALPSHPTTTILQSDLAGVSFANGAKLVSSSSTAIASNLLPLTATTSSPAAAGLQSSVHPVSAHGASFTSPTAESQDSALQSTNVSAVPDVSSTKSPTALLSQELVEALQLHGRNLAAGGTGTKMSAGVKSMMVVYRFPKPQQSSSIPKPTLAPAGSCLSSVRNGSGGKSGDLARCVVAPSSSNSGPSVKFTVPVSSSTSAPAPQQISTAPAALSSSAPGVVNVSGVGFATDAPRLTTVNAASTIAPKSMTVNTSKLGFTTVAPNLATASASTNTACTSVPSLITVQASNKSPGSSGTPTVILLSPPLSSTAVGNVSGFPKISAATSLIPPPPPPAAVAVSFPIKTESCSSKDASPSCTVLMTCGEKLPVVSQNGSSSSAVSQLAGSVLSKSAVPSANVRSSLSASPSVSSSSAAAASTSFNVSHDQSSAGSKTDHSLSQALFQLAHTAQADQMNYADVSAPTSSQSCQAGAGIVSTDSKGLSTQGVTGGRISVGHAGGLNTPQTQYSLYAPLQSSIKSEPHSVSTLPSSSSTIVVEGTATAGASSVSMLPAAESSMKAVDRSGGDGETVTWDRHCTLKLIELYKEHQMYLTDHHYKKKSVWDLIATKLRQSVPEGPPFRWSHVENKWKNMTKKFRDCISHNRRHPASTETKCSYFHELAQVYHYDPRQEHRQAVEGLRALKSAGADSRKSSGSGVGGSNDCLTMRLASIGTMADSVLTVPVVTKAENDPSTGKLFASTLTHTDGLLLPKKKKYARLEGPSSSSSTAHPPQKPPPSLSPHPSVPEWKGKEGGVKGEVDVVGVLRQLREERERQERWRMDRLEAMHREKMAMFGQFLDILQQSKPSGGQ